MTIRFVAQTLNCQKLGATLDEMEDAHRVDGFLQDRIWGRTYSARANRRRYYAVADGATTSSFSREWAETLVHAFVHKNGPTTSGRWPRLKHLQDSWWHKVSAIELPWYGQEKLREGSHATFLGLRLSRGLPHAKGQGSWIAVAAGDTCIFQVRDDTLITRFPITTAGEFSNSPALLSTKTVIGKRAVILHRYTGRWQVNDTFYLMTDALAAWFLRQWELGVRPWHTLQHAATSPSDWETWLNDQRGKKTMRNDDVTCVMVRVEGHRC